MKIIEGELPTGTCWRVLIPQTPGQELGRSWQLASLLARAHDGEVLIPIVVPDDNEYHRASARQTLQRVEAQAEKHAKLHVYPFIVAAADYHKGLRRFLGQNSIDLLIDDISDPLHHNHNQLDCAVMAVRGDTLEGEVAAGLPALRRILVPTSGGPNSIYALSVLLPLASELEITAAYFAPEHLGENEVALGRHRLRQTLDFIDAGDRIKTKLVSVTAVAQGITDEAARDYDVVVIGATRESSVDKVLFGNIPDLVVRQSKRPIVVVRQPKDRVGHLLGRAGWYLQRIIPRLSLEQRTEAYVRIRRGARPNIDFYVLIGLSALIASLGLIVNSPAVVIGAMLVAPLMSPIVGTGLAIVLGDTRFLRLSLGAVARGALLAIVLGALMGLFVLGTEPTAELSARTQPSLLDLGIALFSGMAGAYALSHSNAAGALPGVAIAAALVPPLATVGVVLVSGYVLEALGALLLFVTNFVAISSATAFTFLTLGFRPTTSQKARKEVQVRSARVAIISLAVVAALLFGTSYVLGEQRAREARIRQVVEEKLAEVAGAQLVEMTIVDFSDRHLQLDIIARSTQPIGFQQTLALQEQIGATLGAEGIIDDIGLTLTVIRVTELDPLTPPTATPTPTPSPVPTAGPTETLTPVPTDTAVPTDAPVPTATATLEPTATATIIPTDTPVPTATPRTAVVVYPLGINLRSEPAVTAEVLAILPPDSVVELLDGVLDDGSLVWQEVLVDGEVGWVSNEYLNSSP